MKPLFEQICGFLDERNWQYQPEWEQQHLILEVEDLTVVVEVSENGEFVKIFLPQLLTISNDHPHYEAALQTLRHLGWQHDKLARWQRDPDDGEVRLQADLPLEDSELTEKQFWQTLEGTLQIAQQGRERVRGVLETGEDQAKKTQTVNFGVDSQANEQIAFLSMLFEKILAYQGNAQQIYPILRENLHHLNTNLIPALEQYWQILQSRETDQQSQLIPAIFGEFGNLIQQFPLGNKSWNLEIAIKCYEDALTVWKPDTAPLEWATTQNNLGNAYLYLPTGDRAANLQQAINCYQKALTVWKPDTAPLDWAMTQNNLGTAYLYLPTGDRAANLQRAIKCYESALTVWQPELFPLECLQTARNWANLEFNQGHWQQALKQYQTGIEAIEQSRRFALSEDRRQQIVREQ